MRSLKGILVVTAVMLLATGAHAEMTNQGQLAGHQPSNWINQTTLYNQTGNASGNLASVQNFEAAYDAYDAEGADDFVVTWADGWNIEQAGAIAGYWNGTGPASSVNVVLYSNASGVPGSAVCTYMNNSFTDDGAGNFLMDFGTPCYLPAGTYWFGFQGNLDFAVGGQFGWGTETVQTGFPGMWQNPGDGFGTGCTSWTPRASCSTIADPDFSFLLNGTEAVGPTPTPPPPSGAAVPVPAMSNFGMVAMILLVIGVAILVMWRRS